MEEGQEEAAEEASNKIRADSNLTFSTTLTEHLLEEVNPWRESAITSSNSVLANTATNAGSFILRTRTLEETCRANTKKGKETIRRRKTTLTITSHNPGNSSHKEAILKRI